jgi:hypothetical protein
MKRIIIVSIAVCVQQSYTNPLVIGTSLALNNQQSVSSPQSTASINQSAAVKQAATSQSNLLTAQPVTSVPTTINSVGTKNSTISPIVKKTVVSSATAAAPTAEKKLDTTTLSASASAQKPAVTTASSLVKNNSTLPAKSAPAVANKLSRIRGLLSMADAIKNAKLVDPKNHANRLSPPQS